MPMYSYTAINALASNDTGHFVFLSPWQFNACLSITEQASPLYLWMSDQNPLTPPEIDDLQAQLAQTQDQLMTTLTGLIMPIAAAAAPPGTLLCDGSIHFRIDYPNLYAVLDPAFIIDADSFAVPDLRDRFILGDGITQAVGDTGGSRSHTQTEDELAPHVHTSPPHSHTESGATGTIVSVGLEPPVPAALPSVTVTGSTAVTIDSAGGGQPMDITPPFLVLKYVVVAL